MASLVECTKNTTLAIADSLRYGYTQMRVVIGIAVGGGLGTLLEMFQDGNFELFDKASRVRLCHAFIKGSVVAVIFHFVPRPIKSGTKDSQIINRPCDKDEAVK